MSPLHTLLKELKLLKGRGKVTSVLKLCQAGRLVGGLSVSLHALPDEVLGPLVHVLGPEAKALRIEDSFGTRPMQLHVRCGDLFEKWEVEDVAGLIHNINDLFKARPGVNLMLVLGEWEDMLQILSVRKEQARRLLESRLVDCVNQRAVMQILEPREEEQGGY